MSESSLSLIVNQAWQIAVLTIVVALLVRITARNRPHLAHALWMLVLIKCVTPPLWGHSLGVFSRLQNLALPAEVSPEVEVVNLPAELIVATERSVLDDDFEMQVPLDIEELIPVSNDNTEHSFDAELQRPDVAEEAPYETDLASLGFSDAALEIPPLQPEPTTPAAESPSTSMFDKLPSFLIGGFLIGAVVTLMIMVIRCLGCLRQIHDHRTTEFDDALRERLQQLANQLGVHRVPNIIVSNVLFGPAVLGLLRHTIVLPRCLFDDVGDGWRAERRKSPDVVTLPVMQRQQSEDLRPAARQNVLESGPADFDLHFLDPILAHELLHIRRGDLRTGTLQAIVQSLWWFHPAVWFCNRWLSREAERCCDEQVIAELGCTPAHYARSLLSVIECKHRLQPIPVFPGMKPVEITSQRMERIMSLKNGLKKRTPIWCWLMIVALASVVLPGAVAKPSIDEAATNQTNEAPELPEEDEDTAQSPEFEGNVFWSDTDLLKHLGEHERIDNVDRATMRVSDCESIKAKYRNVGFFDVEVLAITSAADNPSSSRVRFEVTEGRRYEIREIRFEGNSRISASDLQQSSNLKPGDKYSAFEAVTDIQRIREQYNGLGLKSASINPVPHFVEEPGVVDLIFEIDENPVATYSKKTYDVSDLLTRLADDQGIPWEDAHRQLHRVLEKFIWGLSTWSEEPSSDETTSGSSTSQERPTAKTMEPADFPVQYPSIQMNGDQLAVSTSGAVHAKISEELSRFRKLGFKQFQVTARVIVGPAAEINTLMSSLELETPFSETKKSSLVEIQHNVPDNAKSDQSAVTTYQTGTTGIVSREKALAIEELARSKTDSLIVERLPVLAYNGQTAVTHAGELNHQVEESNGKHKAMIGDLIDALTIRVTPTVVDDGVIRLQCVSSLEGVGEMQPESISAKGSESPQSVKSSPIASRRVQSTVELRHDQTLLLSGITMPHNGESRGVLVVLDAVPVSIKPLTSLIRLDESFIPSPETVLTSDTVLVFVADRKITVADVTVGFLSQLDKDTKVTPEQKNIVLLSTVMQRLPGYLYDEVALHEFRQTLSPDKEPEIRESLKPAFSAVLENMSKNMGAKDTNDLERILLEKGFSTEEMRESFMRRQFVVGYSQSMPVGSPIQNQAAIEAHCRQLLFEARLRQKVSVHANQSSDVGALLDFVKKYDINISHVGISNDARLPSRTMDIIDQPLLDALKAIVEPHGFQVAVGKEEVVLTAKPKEDPIAKEADSTILRVPAMPLPRWIMKSSSGPLVKLVWDARNASQRRLLMTDQRTPWQFMNGLAAMRGNFLLREGDEAVVGLDWLNSNSEVLHRPWFQKTKFGGQPDPHPAPIWLDDHAEQFIATLAMNNVPLDAKFATADGTITMSDMIKHLQMTVNEKKLTPWTLIALSEYLPRNETWTNGNGEQWSIERLVKIEVDKPRHTTTPLSLLSLAVARNHYFQAGEPFDGIWQQVDHRILAAIENARPSQTSDGRINTPYAPIFQSQRYQYRSRFGPPIAAQRMAPNDIQRVQMDLEGNRGIQLAAFPTDIGATSRAHMLLFLTIAIPDNELGKEWIRREIEIAANDLVADWSNPETRPPFYETTQALSVYLERYAVYLDRIDDAGLSPVFAGDVYVKVAIRGVVKQWQSYQTPAGTRVLDAITSAGGPQDESADTVSIIRHAGKQAQPTIVRLNLERAKRGADPNIFLISDDEVLVHSAEIVRQPLSASIRLDHKFVLSPDISITSDTVIAFVNDKPITVEKIMGSAWDRLQKATTASESWKNQIAREWIASTLPDFVYQELVLQYFQADALKPAEDISRKERQLTDQMFVDALEKTGNLGTTEDTRRRIAQNLGGGLARGSRLEHMQKQQQVDAYVRMLDANMVASTKSAVTKYAQELVTTARLRSVVSFDYTNTTLTEVIRSVDKVYGLDIKVNSLHEQISQHIFDRPATVNFHAENQPLGDGLTTIFEPFGLTLSLVGSDVRLQFADQEQAMQKYYALLGPPSFGVFGILRNPGWHPLNKEIRLLDALTLAGDIENSDGVSISITNPDIIQGKAIPISMSLRILKNDNTGKLNRIIKNGDIITVTRNGSPDTEQAKRPGILLNGKGVKGESGIVGTFHVDEASWLQLRSAEAKRRNIKLRMLKNSAELIGASSADEIFQLERKKRELELELENVPTVTLSGTGIVQAAATTVKPNHKANSSTLTPARYGASVPQKMLGPGRAPQEIFPTPDLPMPIAIQQSSDPLVQQVWQMRDSTRRRLLSTDQFTPWQLMQGLNGLRRDFVLKHDGKVINGLEWIQTGPMFDGEPWFQKTAHGGQAHPYTKPYAFQGHINQFAATLAMCDVPLDAQFGTPDGPITMEDMIKNAQMTANEKEEVCWTLQLLSKYLPPDAEWVNANGEKWSIERLVKTAINKATPDGSPDGGTCGLFALAVARNEYLRTGKPLTGAWLDADKAIQKHIQLVHDQRNPNGTLSSKYFRGREEKKDFDKRLASSGALLQFLLMAVSEEQLKEDWVRQAVTATVQDLDDNRKSFVSCSPLFGATNALSIFLERFAAPKVANVNAASKDDSPEDRFVLNTYHVADLLVYEHSGTMKVGGSAATMATAPLPILAGSLQADRKVFADQGLRLIEPRPYYRNGKADFAPLMELIKATVRPESWDSLGTANISVDEKTQSLVIRHTNAAHDEITELLLQIRGDADRTIYIKGMIVKLTDESQETWMKSQCSLHSLESGTQWALLSKQRSQTFTRDLLARKPDVLSRPEIVTISGRLVEFPVGQLNPGDDSTGIRLKLTSHLLSENKVIRLQHAVEIGQRTSDVQLPSESLVGSGQTLILRVDSKLGKNESKTAPSKYLLMMTPEYIPLVEEEEILATPQADIKAEENP